MNRNLIMCWEYRGPRGRVGHRVVEAFCAYRRCTECPQDRALPPWDVYVCDDCGGHQRAGELLAEHLREKHPTEKSA